MAGSGHPCLQAAYLSGGIGEEERERMLARENSFNLKLIFAEKSGAYLADVRLIVKEMSGDTLLELRSAGPIVLVRLPAGSFDIEASSDGYLQRRHITIGGKTCAVLTFLWQPE